MSDTAYRGQHRMGLDDDSEIERLEREKAGLPEPEPEAPAPEDEPPAPPEPPKGAEEQTYAKRYADLRRHAQATEQRLKASIEDLQRQVEAASKRALQLPTSEAEVAAWAKEFPDVARIVEAIAAKKADERAQDVEKRVQAAEAREREAAKRAAVAELLRIHPDFDQLRGDPAFHAWAGDQPRWVQSALYEDLDPRAAARAIDLYKLDTAPKRGRPRKDEAAEAAAAVPAQRKPAPDPNEGKRQWRESDVAKMSARDFDRLEDEILQARREGRFVYDLSAAA